MRLISLQVLMAGAGTMVNSITSPLTVLLYDAHAHLQAHPYGPLRGKRRRGGAPCNLLLYIILTVPRCPKGQATLLPSLHAEPTDIDGAAIFAEAARHCDGQPWRLEERFKEPVAAPLTWHASRSPRPSRPQSWHTWAARSPFPRGSSSLRVMHGPSMTRLLHFVKWNASSRALSRHGLVVCAPSQSCHPYGLGWQRRPMSRRTPKTLLQVTSAPSAWGCSSSQL